MTASKEIGNDAVQFFKNMALGNLNMSYKNLLVAPADFKRSIIALIDEEIEKQNKGEDAGILFKLNSLTDREIIDKLSQASNAGVKVKLIVRGICCILPEVEGFTENITITSIVGRYEGIINRSFSPQSELALRIHCQQPVIPIGNCFF